jgi:hypothetical protein
MLANTNALGQPVACMRFMGGREFAALAGEQPALCGSAALAKLVAQRSMALPCFAETGGPFAGRVGSFEGPPAADAAERTALATLYCALMTDYCLDALGAEGPVTIEGSFTGNPWFARVLGALRPAQAVEVSADASGTTCGGWMLENNRTTGSGLPFAHSLDSYANNELSQLARLRPDFKPCTALRTARKAAPKRDGSVLDAHAYKPLLLRPCTNGRPDPFVFIKLNKRFTWFLSVQTSRRQDQYH